MSEGRQEKQVDVERWGDRWVRRPLYPWSRGRREGGRRRAVRCKRLFGSRQRIGDFGPDALSNQDLEAEDERKQGHHATSVCELMEALDGGETLC